MTTVYLATAGEYSDFRVMHAFARREDAEAYKLGDGVLELEVSGGPVEVRRWHTLFWLGNQPDREEANPPFASNPWIRSDEMRDFDGNEKHVQHDWSGDGDYCLEVQGWDLALVKKVYGEQRAQYLARKEEIS